MLEGRLKSWNLFFSLKLVNDPNDAVLLRPLARLSVGNQVKCDEVLLFPSNQAKKGVREILTPLSRVILAVEERHL